ncbi:MAG: class I SAM-dependent methyltransferase [Clostridiales bacterium]|jgi:ubiquinone/menaquinone biosynthesis C-methylase UbiE|nr:class I SAM-dependent methyltransferase [Clostridiales bacterium]
MFICSSCGKAYDLPICENCGCTVAKINDIWQLSDDPDIVTDSDGDKYIGYEFIGENYSGNRRNTIEYSDALFADEISKITGDGIFLDLGCGDGSITVPAARNGTNIIAADISNTMITLLKQKAAYNNISLNNVILCRMNALRIMLPDNFIDSVVSNGVLHLISNPEKVIQEIHRVLKSGGCFVFRDDVPGKTVDMPFDNDIYNKIVNEIFSLYWKTLKEHDIYPKKYNWNFDREEICTGLFSFKEQIVISVSREYLNKMKDGFLPRIKSRGFSDQVDVPSHLHDIVMQNVIEQIEWKYGKGFDEVAFRGIEPNIEVTIYKK